MLVDAHNHLVADDQVRYPTVSSRGGVQSGWSQHMHLTADEFLAHMDEAGVDKATVVQGLTAHGFDCSYLADSVARYPDRFVGVGNIDARAPDAAETMTYWVVERGLKAIRLFTDGSTITEPGTWLDGSAIEPYWQHAIELSIPIFVKTSLEYMPRLHNVMRRHPELKVVIEAMGDGPGSRELGGGAAGGAPYGTAEPFFSLADYPNLVAVKITNATLDGIRAGIGTPEQFLKAVADTFGGSRMLWGTNFPATRPPDGTPSPYKKMIDEARDVVGCLSAEDQRWFLGATAVSLFSELA